MLKKLMYVCFSLILATTFFSFTGVSKELNTAYDVAMPNEFDQAPEFKEMVETGELPPVEERLPKDPLVVEPNESIGEYGGVVQSGTALGITSWGEDIMMMDCGNSYVRPSADGGKLHLNFAKDIEISDAMDTYTFHLREGVKWSDGESFTTEDIKFWYEDILLNKELTPVISKDYKDGNGEVMNITIIDDYTFKVEFGTPKPFFLESLVHWSLEPHAKHYLKQFHPDYVSEDELEAKMEKEGFDEWYQLLEHMNSGLGHAKWIENAPTLGPYILKSRDSHRRVWERNPYYWKIDSAGNQLPYLKRIETELASDREVLNGRIMSGEIDFAAFETDIRNYPMFKKYEDKGNYKTKLWTSGMGSEVIYMFNLTHKNENLREIFQNVNFRRAMSLAIDRQEINESIYFGRAEPRQFTVIPSSKYFKPEYEKAYIEYDPEKAKELLNKIGLKDQDGDGWREMPNGEDFQFTLEVTLQETPKKPNVELVTSHWQDIGIDVKWKVIGKNLHSQRVQGNLLDANIWHGDTSTDILFPISTYSPVIPQGGDHTSSTWQAWGQWFISDGEEGEEPPTKFKEIYGWYEEMLVEPDEARRIELGQKILKEQAENLWCIGTVGKAPWVVIADNNLRNLPEDIVWVYDTFWSTTVDPEQFYFEGGKRSN